MGSSSSSSSVFFSSFSSSSLLPLSLALLFSPSFCLFIFLWRTNDFFIYFQTRFNWPESRSELARVPIRNRARIDSGPGESGSTQASQLATRQFFILWWDEIFHVATRCWSTLGGCSLAALYIHPSMCPS